MRKPKMDYKQFHNFMQHLWQMDLSVMQILQIARIANPMPSGYEKWSDQELIDILFDRKGICKKG
tara:strand:+ start:126 stop:320 length:195 start_codon:yes stop_codon:yes gene_type:complete